MTAETIPYKPLFDGIEVSRDGKFLRNGKPKSVICTTNVAGKKVTAQVTYNINGKRHYWQAAKLVAMAWKPKYTDGCNIIYKDGDIHNIHADNLLIVGDREWWDYMQRNSGYHGATLEERKLKLDMVIKEAGLTRDFLDRRDFADINRHVQERLLPVLEDYCINTLHLGVKPSKQVVPQCLARMYECIDSGMCLYNYERYCKKLLLNYKKKGSFGLTGNIPKPIWSQVNNLKLDCLCERFNKKKHQ